MYMNLTNQEFESLNQNLHNDEKLQAYKSQYQDYKPSYIPKVLGSLLVWCGNIVYGHTPSYLKFRAVEVIARVPYHSWSSAAYTLLTIFYTSEKRSLSLSRTATFAGHAQENETMHVVVISQLCKSEAPSGFIRHTCIPMLFAFFYFWASYTLYLIKPKYSYELNFLFENHAFEQYSLFLEQNKNELTHKKIESDFLKWYGRTPHNQYEFFMAVRNDEIIHRNMSIDAIYQNIKN